MVDEVEFVTKYAWSYYLGTDRRGKRATISMIDAHDRISSSQRALRFHILSNYLLRARVLLLAFLIFFEDPLYGPTVRIAGGGNGRRDYTIIEAHRAVEDYGM